MQSPGAAAGCVGNPIIPAAAFAMLQKVPHDHPLLPFPPRVPHDHISHQNTAAQLLCLLRSQDLSLHVGRDAIKEVTDKFIVADSQAGYCGADAVLEALHLASEKTRILLKLERVVLVAEQLTLIVEPGGILFVEHRLF